MKTPLCFRVRQRIAGRTRIVFPCLRHQEARCDRVRRALRHLEGVAGVEVRMRSGAVILVHPLGPPDLPGLLDLVVSGLDRRGAGDDPLPDSGPCPGRCSASARQKEACGHVSGPILVLSGLYLLVLSIRRMILAFTPASAAAPVFTLPALVALGLSLPIQRQAVDNLRRSGRPDMGLISTGLLYGSLLTGRTLAALTVFWLFNLSSWLEDRIRIRTRQAVREMLGQTCRQAWLLRDGAEIEVDAGRLRPGDVIVLRLGNAVPADGTVLAGSALIDEAALTGEDEPVPRCPGDSVLAGTVVLDGFLRVRIDRSGEDTRLAAIIRLIENAENDPGDLQQGSRRLSQAMVPVSLGLATLAFLVTGDLLQAMAVVIITCPCALRLATSVAVSRAMSNAAQRGILVKGGRYVELAGQVRVLVLDKTGTLTDRSAEVTAIRVLDHRFREKTVIGLAASAQQSWSHPLSRALRARAEAMQVPLLPVEEAELVVGQGVRARIGQQSVLVGQASFLEKNGIMTGASPTPADQAGSSRLLVARNGGLIGSIEISHRLRPGTARAMDRLRAMGMSRIVLLTGDSRAGFADVHGLGFDQVLFNQSPEAKAAWITAWKQDHPRDVVAMVGDGINDTPAFAAADLSLAIGEGGTDVTVEYADIVLQPGGIDQVAQVLTLGRQTLTTIERCYGLAIGLNTVILTLTTLGLLSPVSGALLHNLTTVLAVANASTPARIRSRHNEAPRILNPGVVR